MMLVDELTSMHERYASNGVFISSTKLKHRSQSPSSLTALHCADIQCVTNKVQDQVGIYVSMVCWLWATFTNPQAVHTNVYYWWFFGDNYIESHFRYSSLSNAIHNLVKDTVDAHEVWISCQICNLQCIPLCITDALVFHLQVCCARVGIECR